MTAYGPPGAPPPQPPGGYGPPPGGPYGAPRRSFDPKSVDPLDWGILGATLLAFIFSFFSYYTYNPKGQLKAACGQSGVPGFAHDLCNGGDSAGAWHGFFGWFGVLLALIGAAAVAVAIFAPQLRLPVPARLIALAAFVLGLIFTLIALAVIPDWPPAVDQGDITGGQYDKYLDNGHGFSYWIVLIMIIIAAALCFLRFQRTGGVLPGLGGRGTGTGTGPGSGATPGAYGQPVGYAPPPQPGYVPPPSAPPTGMPPQTPPPGAGYPPPQTPPPGAGYPPPQTPPPGTGYPPPQTPPQPGTGYQPPTGP